MHLLVYGMSDKGWTDMELLSYWMKELFLLNIPPAHPVLLLLDGHYLTTSQKPFAMLLHKVW